MTLKIPVFLPAVEALGREEGKIKAGGLWGGSRALFIAQVAEELRRPTAIVTPSPERAEELFKELGLWFRESEGKRLWFPSWDILPYEPSTPRPDMIAERIGALSRLQEEGVSLLVLPVEALLQRVISPEELGNKTFKLHPGDECSQEDLVGKLEEGGYRFASAVESYGQASLRGGIVDLFSPLSPHPIRLEFFGDRIESIRAFDVESQKSILGLDEATVLPGSEDLSRVLFYSATLYDYLPSSTLWIFEEPQEAEQQVKVFLEEVREAYAFSSTHKGKTPEPGRLYLSWNEVVERREVLPRLDLESLMLTGGADAARVNFDSQSPKVLGFGQEGFQKAAERLAALREDHTIILAARTNRQSDRIKRLLADHDLSWSGEDPMLALAREDGTRSGGSLPIGSPLILVVADLSEGFYLPSAKFLCLTEEELFGKRFYRHRVKPNHPAPAFGLSLDDLKIGDSVVHLHYGIGRYTGLQRLSISGNSSDFLVLEYFGGDKIYVPLDSLRLVQRYVGPEGVTPRLERLGGRHWKQTYQRVKKEIQEMTTELLNLYAEREVASAHRFSPEGALSEEFAASFDYEETPDQQRAIEEVLKNMEGDRPMDRLVCGDVGFGKTEVAMRAAFKAIMDGKQVAVVVPTTLLAQQHAQTFSRRFSRYSVRTESLSRFRSSADQKRVLKELARGEVDIVIGTHRLLQKDVQFRDLGLLIVDEEHRFGVAHKERIKQLRKNVHVLTLTATPIPRTLQMSLAGLRDLSTIETPPADRLAIRTILAPFDPGIIREAILRELARGGQAFFVHNRIENIEAIGRFLSDLIPEARIAVAHGQMRERQLEEVMLKFVDRQFDILLTTTIVESGLDIPTANTMLINNADRFGLAELYQLRGRVGRSGEQAYAYFLVREGAVLTEDARARLRAIQEFTELGSGFRIAARDLEIRGAGNLLGSEQSGHVAEVGFDLYLQMIEEASRELKGGKSVQQLEPQLLLPVSAYIPEEYVADTSQRLSVYRRLASLQEEGDLRLFCEELADRYGSPPEPLLRLLEVMRLKIICRGKWISRLEVGERHLRIQVDPSAKIESSKVERLLTVFRGRIHFLSSTSFELRQNDLKDWERISEEIQKCLSLL